MSDTPLMRQWRGIKEEYPDMLLLFRMGDFYELFFDDAARASALLNIHADQARRCRRQADSNGGRAVSCA